MKDDNTLKTPAPERDIFTDPNINTSRETYDPIAEFIKRQWRPLLITVIVAFAAVYIRDTFRETRQRSLEGGADAFFEAQEALSRFKEARKKIATLGAAKSPEDAAAKEAQTKERDAAQADLKNREERVQQTLTILAESPAPYNRFAPIVAALLAHEKGDVEGARSALKEYTPEKLASTKGADRFVTELALMARARTLLDSPANEGEAKSILVALAQGGEHVAASAALTLSRIASSEEEKKQAKELKEGIIAKYPEQAVVLRE